jgi:hypothetical protein
VRPPTGHWAGPHEIICKSAILGENLHLDDPPDEGPQCQGPDCAGSDPPPRPCLPG